MMKRWRIVVFTSLIIPFAISSTRCRKIDGDFSYKRNYIFNEYIVPRRISFEGASYDVQIFCITGNSITLKNDKERYLELAKEYGDNGKEFLWGDSFPPIPDKPLWITGIRVFLREGEKKKEDISKEFTIKFWDLERLVRNVRTPNRSGDKTVHIYKDLTNLTENDYYWFPSFFSLETERKSGEFLLEVELRGGRKVSRDFNKVDKKKP